MSTITEALNSPVSPGVAAHVWQAHEEQLERMKNGSIGSTEMRGELKWTLTGGYQFTPDSSALDVLMDRIAAGTWAAGFKVTVTL
tara:strand:+ start:113 stop:367 length:255 start_codon:yes stop_codon:yes gene_type:complete